MKASFAVKVGPARFRIGSDWAQPLVHMQSLYADYPIDSAEGYCDFTVRLEAARPWRRWLRPAITLRADYMIPDAAPLALEHGVLAAEMAMNLQMALGWRRHLLLHASAVEKDGRALIMTGDSGSGKSTLAALLGERGWRLMGDEFTLLGLASRSALTPSQAFAFPRPVSLKNEAISAMEAIVPVDRFGPRLVATPKGDIRHLKPRADALARMDAPATPALLLYPRYGFAPDIRAVAPSENFIRLTQASTNYVALGAAGYDALTQFVRTVPARAIDYGSSAEAIALVDQLWGELA